MPTRKPDVPPGLKDEFRQYFEAQLPPKQQRSELTEDFDPLLRELLTFERGQAVYDAFQGNKDDSRMLRSDMLLLGLIKAIPPRIDLTLSPPKPYIAGLELHQPAKGQQGYYPKKVPYVPDLNTLIQRSAAIVQIDIYSEMRASSNFHLQKIKNTYSNVNGLKNLIRALKGLPLAQRTKEIFDCVLPQDAPPPPLYEANSEIDLNETSGLDMRKLLNLVLATDIFTDAEACLFHYTGVFVKDAHGDIQMVPSTPAYEEMFYGGDDKEILKREKRKITKIEPKNKEITKLETMFRKKIMQIIHEVLDDDPPETLSPLESYSREFKQRTGIAIEPIHIRNHRTLDKPEARAALLSVLAPLKPLLQRTFTRIFVQNLTPEAETSPDPQDEKSIQLEIVRNQQNIYPKMRFELSRTLELKPRDLRLLQKFEATYRIAIYQKVLKQAFGPLMNQGEIREALEASIGESTIQSTMRNTQQRGFNGHDENSRIAALYLHFTNWGAAYFQEKTDDIHNSKIPETLRRFFDYYFSTPEPELLETKI